MNVHRVFFDNGSSTNILYYSTYKKLGFSDSDMNFDDTYIYGFTGEAVRVMGSVRLPITLGEGALSVTQMIDFKVPDQDSAHNVLVGRPWLLAFKVITSIHHLMIKFPTPNRVGSLRGSQYKSRDCYYKAVKEFRRRRYEGKGLPFKDAADIQAKPSGDEAPLKSENEIEVDAPQNEDASSTPALHKAMPCPEVDAPTYRDVPSNVGMEVLDPRDFNFNLDPRIPMPAEKMGPAEETISVPVDKDDPSKVLKVGSKPSYETRERLTHFLIKNLDVFAWIHSDMVEIDLGVMCHRLNIFPNCTGIRQKRRPVSEERVIALKEEVDRLSEVGLIKESFYPEWLANPVLVKKPNGKWRTYLDFTDLNKTCPKDSFPLPKID
ncbi:uncharacterized protein LOC141685934 [Apium graveolens]|uniref:uncharacterized protein LOC141685934 n=1 Tax=Apium graveolens TaxID=4045 RepID=UPI003D7AA12C